MVNFLLFMGRFFLQQNKVIVLTIIVVSFLIVTTSVHAQTTPTITPLFTWHANTLYPAPFTGKPLATPGAVVVVGLDLLLGGKFFDVSTVDIQWYLDDAFVVGGPGLQTFSFDVSKRAGDFHFIRVIIKRSGGTIANISTRVPVSAPVLALEQSKKPGTVAPGDEVTVRAVPYFFAVDTIGTIVFTWYVNSAREVGVQGSELTFRFGEPTTESSRTVPIKVTASVVENPILFARHETLFTIR